MLTYQFSRSLRRLITEDRSFLASLPRCSSFSTSIVKRKIEYKQTDRGIKLCDGKSPTEWKEFLYVWLRDHCSCSTCFNKVTNQRQLDVLSLKLDEKPKLIELSKEDNKVLQITWSDDHKTAYNVPSLLNKPTNAKNSTSVVKLIWDKQTINSLASLPTVCYSEIFEKYGQRKHIKQLLTYGFSSVVDAPPTYEATQEVCSRVGLVEENVFGKFWKFSNESMDHADTAYTKLALPAHTDCTYYNHTAGFQVFHCLEHVGEGGETILVDGFKVCEILKRENLEAFDFLRQTPIPHQFIDKTDFLLADEPVIRIKSGTGEILQLRYNPCDRAPLSTSTDAKTMEKFYQYYVELSKIIRDPKNELMFKMRPGSILFFDNFRILHGRAAFSGKRVIAGCYLSRDDFMSKARVIGLL